MCKRFDSGINTALYLSYTWETVKLTKMNANRRNWFCCLVLSYCDRWIWIAIDESGWQNTKLNDNVLKLIDQRRNWNEHSHIAECPGRNWKHIIFFLKRWWKCAGKPIINIIIIPLLHQITLPTFDDMGFQPYVPPPLLFNIKNKN